MSAPFRLRLPDGRHATITLHAAERYVERVRCTLDAVQASRELARVAEHGVLFDDPPDWLASRGDEHAAGWLVIGDVALPISRERDGERLLVTTAFIRGGPLPSEDGLLERDRAYRRSRRGARGRQRKNVSAFRGELRDAQARQADRDSE